MGMESQEISSNADGLVKPVIAMVVTQIAYAAMNILYKLATESGMTLSILVAYRLMFSSAVVIPLALILERKNRPKLTVLVLFQAFLCGLFGATLSQNLFIEALVLTSATFASATANLIPAITFITAICFRLEKLKLGSNAGRAKVIGTLLGIGGAMLFTFYKGPEFALWSRHVDILRHHHHGSRVAPPPSSSSHGSSGSHLLGCFLAFGSGVSFALWLIVQAKMSKNYPSHYSSAALMSVMGAIQSTAFAMCVERDWRQWKLGWNVRLLTAAYSGIVTSGLVTVLITWCVRKRGPLFVSIFTPLCLVIVAVYSALLLGEKLNVGSVLGGILIICGLYMVLWGNSKEMKMMKNINNNHQNQQESTPVEEVEAIVTTTPAST